MNDSEQISCLQDKISRLQNREVKYIWELRLTEDEFKRLEDEISQSIAAAKSQKHLFTRENALYTIVYVAEWYKRRYNGLDTDKDTCVVKLDDNCKQLWENSIYDSNTYVYDASSNPDKPSRQWIRSLYLMGGLALQQELNRVNDDRFLVELCRLYHGESTDIMTIDDRTRSIPFQCSITEKHSLFLYIASILKGDYPFAKEEIDDPQSLANQFIKRIQEANIKAKSEKFDFEWVIIYNGLHASASRNLKVKLRPEEIGGALAKFISFERAKRYWDIPNIEDVDTLSFDLSFIDNGREIQKPNFKQPFMTFRYSDEGFDYVGTDIDKIYYQNVPIGDFTAIQVWVKYGNEIKAIGAPRPFLGYIQIYKSPKDNRTWTSHRIAGAESAVLLSSRCRIKNQEEGYQCENLNYVNKNKQSEPVSWCPIYASVTIVNGDGREVQLRNAVGKYQLLVKRYSDTIRYINSVQVDHFYRFNGTSEDNDRIPVLFGWEGLELLFYSKEDADAELVPLNECTIEWSQANSRYISLLQQVPHMGKCTFRVTWDKKAQTQSLKVFYVPFTKEGDAYPLWRDLDNQYIRCNVEGYQDKSIPYEKNYQPVEDVVEYKLGNNDDYVMLQIYRPVAISELYRGEKLIEYLDEDVVSLPILSANEYSIRRFDKDGVHRLIPAAEEANALFNSFASIALVSEDLYTKSQRVNSMNYYITKETTGRHNWYAWDYCSEPIPVENPDAWRGDGIVFESYKDVEYIRESAKPIYRRTSPFAIYPPVGVLADVDCFDIISEHRTYFVLFRPMQQLASRKQFVKELFIPLVQKRGGVLTDSDKTNLYRFAREFLFDWLLLPRDEWQQAIDELPNSDQVQMKACVEELFRSHPLVKKDYDKRCMGDFIDKYWTFNHYYTDNKAIALALDLILGNTLTRGHNPQSVIREFHESPARFAELCRIYIKQD